MKKVEGAGCQEQIPQDQGRAGRRQRLLATIESIPLEPGAGHHHLRFLLFPFLPFSAGRGSLRSFTLPGIETAGSAIDRQGDLAPRRQPSWEVPTGVPPQGPEWGHMGFAS